MLKKCVIALMCALSLAVPAAAQEEKADKMTEEQFEASLKYRQGRIVLPNGVATIKVPGNFRYLGPDDTKKVLVQAWGNPEGNRTLGMLFPAGISPLSENGWGAVITYEEDGYVSDKDADRLNYDALLKDSKKDVADATRKGSQTIEFVRWAAMPYYDKETHKLYWAKELSFGGDSEHTLNYKVRILGRKGVLVMNAVASMKQFAAVESGMKQILAFSEFNEGYRYSDFNSKTDKVAAYGIAALVAGGVAAKAGLFTQLLALIVAGAATAVAFIAKLFKGKKES